MTVRWRMRILLQSPTHRLAESVTRRRVSLFIRHVDGGSSNAIESELASLIGPVYNMAGIGLRIVASPSHADLMLLTLPLTRNMLSPAEAAFRVMPTPGTIVTTEDWTVAGLTADDADGRRELAAAFSDSYATVALPPEMAGAVVANIPGDPPAPRELVNVLLQVARGRSWWRRGHGPEPTVVSPPGDGRTS